MDNDKEESNRDETPYGVGVLVVKDGRILCGTRHNDTGYGLICGPGGHGEKGETYEQSAFRETEEEFGISPKELIPIGVGPFEPESGLRSHIFLCTDFDGEPDCVDLEMTNPKFRTLEELEELKPSLFPPFADSLEIMMASITGSRDDADDVDWITVNGAHIPLDDDGIAKAGGDLKGKKFSKAKSEKKTKKGSIPKQPAECKNKISKSQQARYAKAPEGQKMLMNMSPEEVNEFVFNAETTDPDYGSGNEKQALQCVLNKLGMNDKPKVVSAYDFGAEEWNSPVGTMYRGVVANEKLGMSAEDVVKNTLYGEETIVGYGVETSGIYFAPERSEVELYAGNGKGKIMKACFSESTRLVDYEKLMELQAKSGIEDLAVCALYHGYNAVIADYGGGEEYMIALDRSTLVFEQP